MSRQPVRRFHSGSLPVARNKAIIVVAMSLGHHVTIEDIAA
jgi:hypothetical protein